MSSSEVGALNCDIVIQEIGTVWYLLMILKFCGWFVHLLQVGFSNWFVESESCEEICYFIWGDDYNSVA